MKKKNNNQTIKEKIKKTLFSSVSKNKKKTNKKKKKTNSWSSSRFKIRKKIITRRKINFSNCKYTKARRKYRKLTNTNKYICRDTKFTRST